ALAALASLDCGGRGGLSSNPDSSADRPQEADGSPDVPNLELGESEQSSGLDAVDSPPEKPPADGGPDTSNATDSTPDADAADGPTTFDGDGGYIVAPLAILT